VSGTVGTEAVFAWPGTGGLALESVYQNDFPLLTGTILFVTLLYTGVNFLVDIAYSLIDPRIRYN
jgi:peptide/nickel transport system permease protein